MTYKYFYLLTILPIVLMVEGCKKDSKPRDESVKVDIASAKAFFANNVFSQRLAANEKNYRAEQDRSLEWDQAKSVALSDGPAIVVPVHYRKELYVSSGPSGNTLLKLSELTKVVITKDSSDRFHYALYTFVPDTTALVSGQWSSGIVLTEDWQGNSLMKPQRFGRVRSSKATSTSAGQKEVDIVQTIQTCTEIDGYNYSPDDPDGGFAWSETTCSSYTMFIPETQATGGTYGAISSAYGVFPIPPALTLTVSPPPGNPIGNIANYFQCFTKGDGGHTFSVMLAVEQPIPGTRTPWALTRGGPIGSSSAGNPVQVGHTWLIFTETTPFGTTTRNVGFYPQSIVGPGFRTAQGVLADDESTDYNISLSVSVNSDQFFAMLNYVMQGNNPGYLYDLNQNNCTSFAVDAMAAGSVPIYTAVGHWVGGGQGVDPGDLGEDIRSMQLQSNMTRNTVSNYHPNTGNCN